MGQAESRVCGASGDPCVSPCPQAKRLNCIVVEQQVTGSAVNVEALPSGIAELYWLRRVCRLPDRID